MANRTFDFEAYEEWADTVDRDGDDVAELFTTGRD
jgi:hypothetical protein